MTDGRLVGACPDTWCLAAVAVGELLAAFEQRKYAPEGIDRGLAYDVSADA